MVINERSYGDDSDEINTVDNESFHFDDDDDDVDDREK